jgi:electron transport protein HydN
MIACARAHEDVPAKELVSQGTPFISRLTLINVPEVTVPIQCRQCEDSPCANACPENAIVQKSSHIGVRKELCIGCKSCILACPFGAIQIAEDPTTQTSVVVKNSSRQTEYGDFSTYQKSLFVVSKCDLCASQATAACIDICPAKALSLVELPKIHDSVVSKRQIAASKLGQCLAY